MQQRGKCRRGNVFCRSAGSGNPDIGFTANYDRYGNRWAEGTANSGGGNQNVSWTYDGVANHVVGRTYDAAGNLMNDSVHNFTYDAEGNMIQIDNGSTAVYVFDALNERVKGTANGVTERYGFDLSGRRSTTWLDGTNTLKLAQYYAGAERIAYWTNTDKNTHFEHADLQGTDRIRSNSAGVVDLTVQSMPFGEKIINTGSTDLDPGHFALLDQDLSDGANLSHATFREYSATFGSWTSPDPYDGSYDFSNPQSLNRYSYVLNNPLDGNDPSGKCGIFTSNVYSADGDLLQTVTTYNYDNCPEPWWVSEYGGPSAQGALFASGGFFISSNNSGSSVSVTPAKPTNTPAPSNPAPNNGRVANTITCATVLPNGQTVGSYVNQLSNSINGSVGNPTSTPYGPGPNPSAPGPISVASQVYSGTNFRKMLGGPGANYAFLGDAGNFAYAAVSANIGVPLIATELAAGAYTLLTHPLSDLGPYGMDPSARVQIPAGYGAGCKVP